MMIFKDLVNNKRGMPALPETLPTAESTFSKMEFDDKWQDAQVVSFCHYLRGSTSLNIPDTFRQLLPKKL